MSYAPWRSLYAQRLVAYDLVAGKFYSTKLFSKTIADCWTVGSVFQLSKHFCLESGKHTEQLHFLVAQKKIDTVEHKISVEPSGVINESYWNESCPWVYICKTIVPCYPWAKCCYWPHHPQNIRFQVKWRRTLLVAVVGFMNGMRPVLYVVRWSPCAYTYVY